MCVIVSLISRRVDGVIVCVYVSLISRRVDSVIVCVCAYVSKISRRVDGVLVCVGWINNTTPVENLLNDISVSSQNKLQLTTSNSSRICKTKKNLLWGEMRGDQFTTESKSIKTWNYIQLTVLLERMVVKHYILILKYKKNYTQTHKTVLLGEKTQLHMFEGNIQYFCNYNKAVNGNTQKKLNSKSRVANVQKLKRI